MRPFFQKTWRQARPSESEFGQAGTRRRPEQVKILRILVAWTVSLALGVGSVPARGETGKSLPPSESPALEEARKLSTEGALLESKAKYKSYLSDVGDPALKETVQRELETLNANILFSKTLTPDSVLYEVKPGDTLYKIAKEHQTTAELIVRSNQLQGFTIYPGMTLKVVTAPFSILVDRSKNRLYLKQGGEVLKTYEVATGEKQSTPLGTFTIENKLVHPTWYRAGAIVPPNSPDNILGTRWLGFSLPGYGIHGTTMPETIGTASSKGCIRMRNEDVEELYAIVPLQAEVTVHDRA